MDTLHWAHRFTSARLRKGWSYTRLATEAEVAEDTAIQACVTGRCSSQTALKLTAALGLRIVLVPATDPTRYDISHAIHG